MVVKFPNRKFNILHKISLNTIRQKDTQELKENTCFYIYWQILNTS